MRELLPREGVRLRACLHVHTSDSDGVLTPAETVRRYREAGYDVVALTDHEIMTDHTALTTPECLVMKGYEIGFSHAGRKTPAEANCHIVLIAKDPAVTALMPLDPAFLREGQTVPPGTEIAHRELTRECVEELLSGTSRAGYFPILAHPFWSLWSEDEYASLAGFAGVEVYNHLCVCAGSRDCSGAALDAFLQNGSFPLPVACDDAHEEDGFFGGFEMIFARDRSYAAVTEALEAGNAYASTGPLIEDLVSEDGYVAFSCTGVREARLLSDLRPVNARLFDPAGRMTWGRLKIPPEASFVRLELTDRDGYVAWTRAWSPREL